MSSELKVNSIRDTSNNEAITISSGNVSFNNTISAGTLGSSVVFPGPASGSFGGHILQANSGMYNFTGDVGFSSTSEVVGPVVSMQIIQANAKVMGLITYGEIYSNTTTGSATMSLAYKTSSFTAGQGNTSHGATVLTGLQCKWRYIPESCTACFVVNGTLSNTANQTIYFASEVVSPATRYLNYAGSGANCTLTVFEVKT
tara:strand:- start:220 stop:822 length:603 start_codon:yes stop_codon:yes gene_type:complete